MTELFHASSAELMAHLNNKTISSVDYLDLLAKRIEQFNPQVNAVVTLELDAAFERARQADAARAKGESWGPLHGLPITIKDTFEVAGMRTTSGAKLLSDYVAPNDSFVARKLKEAGAIIFGKTNTPKFANDIQTYNSLFGVTNNPWHVAHTCGGSSGGSAAAVASGMTPLEFGSDIGGSIRTPSHFNGICGHKPSHNIISMQGHIPGPPGTLSVPDMAVVGPLARSVEDLTMMVALMAGANSLQRTGWQLNLPRPRHRSLADFRVATWFDDEVCPIDPELGAVFEGVAQQLTGFGATVRPTKPVDLNNVLSAYYLLLGAVIGSGLTPEEEAQVKASQANLDEVVAKLGIPDTFRNYVTGLTVPHRKWMSANERRVKLQHKMQLFFGEYDILLSPVTLTTAPLHNTHGPVEGRKIVVNGEERSYVDQFPWIATATLLGLPATVIPVGLSQAGLPIGIQIIGPYLEDYTPLKFAELLAKEIDPIGYPDLI